MHKASIGMAPEGLPFVFLLGLSALVFAALKCWPMALILLALTWFAGHFFRDPERLVPKEAGVAVSPADGRVVRVETRPDRYSRPVVGYGCQFVDMANMYELQLRSFVFQQERMRYKK